MKNDQSLTDIIFNKYVLLIFFFMIVFAAAIMLHDARYMDMIKLFVRPVSNS